MKGQHKMSLYLGNTPIAVNSSSRNIGEIIQSTIPLTDAGLHLLDGSVISGAGSYADFVTYIAGLVSNYPDLFTTETAWQQAVTDYGVCGKFVYDSTNNTVRLPKYNNKIYSGGGIAPVVGNGMTLGITNGTTNKGLYMVASNGELSGSSGYYGTQVGATAASGSGFDAKTYGVATDASKSGLIADLSNITTALDGYYYIVIASSITNELNLDVADLERSKADVDLSNSSVPHIVETYVNGTSWYRVYSDGWCEQGFCYSPPSSSAQTINLLKEYKDTNYTVQTTYNTGSDWGNPLYVYNKTVNNFILTTKSTWNTSNVIAISVCGYIS